MFFRFGSSNTVFYSHAPIIVQWKIVTNSKGSSHWRYTLVSPIHDLEIHGSHRWKESGFQLSKFVFWIVSVFGFNGEIVEHTEISTQRTCPSLPKSSGHAFSAGVSLDPLKGRASGGFLEVLSHQFLTRYLEDWGWIWSQLPTPPRNKALLRYY